MNDDLNPSATTGGRTCATCGLTQDEHGQLGGIGTRCPSPVVYVSVSGGVAEVMAEAGVEVVLIDWDNFEADGLSDPDYQLAVLDEDIERVTNLGGEGRKPLRGVLRDLAEARKSLVDAIEDEEE